MNKLVYEQLPSGWELVRLNDIVKNLQPGFACGKRDENGFVQLRMNNVGLEGRIITDSLLKVPKSETNLEKYRLCNGDIIFNNTNSPELVGKTVMFLGELDDCVYSNHLTRIRIETNTALPEFVTAFLRLEQRKGTFELLCRRFVGQASVPRESLLNLNFPLPPMNEQRRILEKLTELLKEIKSAKSSINKLPKFVKMLRQSILAAAFRGDLDLLKADHEPVEKLYETVLKERRSEWERENLQNARNAKYQEPRDYFDGELPSLPEHWRYVSLESVCYRVQGGATPLRSNPKNFDPNGIPLIKVENIVKNGRIVLSKDQLHINRQVHQKQSRSIVKPNDVLVNIVGPPLGKVGIVPHELREANINQAIVLMRTVPSYHPKFLLYCLLSPFYYNYMVKMSKGVRQSNIRKTDVGRIPIILIPRKEQERIVSKIDDLFNFLDQIESTVFKAKTRTEKTEQSIFVKALSGELVPQDPKDEPASVLLEKIKTETIQKHKR